MTIFPLILRNVGISLIISYPWWYITFCLLAGALYAWLMYRKSPLLSEMSVWTARILVLSRFLLVSLLSFLLLGPMIRSLSRDIEKPIVIVALDESKSMVNSKDSIRIKGEIQNDMNNLQDKLSADYDVRFFSFGDKVEASPKYNFSEASTNFSRLFKNLDVQFDNRNVGAIILATDGLYNDGSSPLNGPGRLKVPIYSIAIGDTTIRKDIFISAVNHNREAFLGNSFPLEIIVDAKEAAGSKTTLTVEEDSTVIFTRSLDITGKNYHTIVNLFPEAKSKGIHHYKIKLSGVEGELTEVNNSRDIFIEVIAEKQKVLLLYAAPHPDISAIRQSLESSPNYEITVESAVGFTGGISEYNLIILHNIPGNVFDGQQLIEKINTAGISCWYILGASTAIDAFNATGSGVKVTQSNQQLNDVQARLADNFSLFVVSEELKSAIGTWPPLKVPFGVYQPQSNIYTLLEQKIGTVNSGQPLLFFSDVNGQKRAVLAGEGIWRWKLNDFNENESHDLSRELIIKIVQYLAVKENRSPFRVFSKSNYKENEPLLFDARLYNQSDQLTSVPEVNFRIINKAGKEFPFTMSRSENTYTLNAGVFPIGNYKFKAEVKLDDRILSQQGEFSVSALQIETAITIADHQLLNAIAAETGAAVFYPGKTDDLVAAIKKNENLKSISFMHKRLEELLNLPIIFVLIVVLLALEWFIRKRAGSY